MYPVYLERIICLQAQQAIENTVNRREKVIITRSFGETSDADVIPPIPVLLVLYFVESHSVGYSEAPSGGL